MAMTYEIRDPLHRTILIDEDERRVLDHPWVQRLRHIRQLGFVSLVYPGAVHDRFQHSLGVMHLAGERWKALVAARPAGLAGYDPADLDYAYRLLRFAGMLHDLGHAPFSHTAEAFFPSAGHMLLPEDWYNGGGCGDLSRRAGHEDCTLAAIHRLAGEGVLELGMARDIAAICSPRVRRSPRLKAMGPLVRMLRALISGELDSDRCDYLLRDSHFTGVSYGVYDLQRLMACETVIDGPDGPELGLDVHGAQPLEGLLLARYHMFLQVYFHKTPPAFEHYLERAVAEGEIDFPVQGVESVLELLDDDIWVQIWKAARAGEPWCRRIVAREPAKLVLRERVGADKQENFLARQLVDELRAAGCHVFTRRSRQKFTDLQGAGGGLTGERLLCQRRVLGRAVTEPITLHSDLLAAFNRPIDLQHTYVLREDASKARAVMERMEGVGV